MRNLLRMTILVGLMVLFGAAEDGMVFGIGSAQAPNWPTPDAHVVRRCRPPYHPPRLQARLLRRLLPLLTERRVRLRKFRSWVLAPRRFPSIADG
jgi:hypothetical protein